MGPFAMCTWPRFASDMTTFDGSGAPTRCRRTSLCSSAAAELVCKNRWLLQLVGSNGEAGSAIRQRLSACDNIALCFHWVRARSSTADRAYQAYRSSDGINSLPRCSCQN